MAVVSSDLLTINSSFMEPTADQMSFVASLTWLPSLTWSAPGLTWGGVTDPRRLKSWLIYRMPVHIGLFDADGNAIGYAAVLREITDVTDYDDGDDTVSLKYEVSIAAGMATGDVATTAVVFGGVAQGVAPFKAWLNPDQIDFPDGEVRVGQLPVSFTLLETVRERIVINLTI
ncbi:hypothetical protein [Shinella sp.]|uniref:hypothetical protein n=1 Tax=Shinella sp. TaxID=1870904 RepID=UPI00289EC608|nr:hypothetical protein [Shinella sp.]